MTGSVSFTGLFQVSNNFTVQYLNIDTPWTVTAGHGILFNSASTGKANIYYLSMYRTSSTILVPCVCGTVASGFTIFVYQSSFSASVTSGTTRGCLVDTISSGATFYMYQSFVNSTEIKSQNSGIAYVINQGTTGIISAEFDRVIFRGITMANTTAGFVHIIRTTNNILISNSYSYITPASSPAYFVHDVISGSTLNFYGCYGYSTGSSLVFVDSNAGTVNITSCATQGTTFSDGTVNITDSQTSFTGGPIPGINDYVLDNTGVNAWNNSISSPAWPFLLTFTTSTAWGSYDSYDDVPVLTLSGVCVVGETLILTPSNYRKIEDLCIGDSIVTRYNNQLITQKIVKKVEYPSYGRDDRIPRKIIKDFFGTNQPFEDTFISSGHAIWIDNHFRHLFHFKEIHSSSEYKEKCFTYYHLCVDKYPSTMFVNGMEVETCGTNFKHKARSICESEECKIWLE